MVAALLLGLAMTFSALGQEAVINLDASPNSSANGTDAYSAPQPSSAPDIVSQTVVVTGKNPYLEFVNKTRGPIVLGKPVSWTAMFSNGRRTFALQYQTDPIVMETMVNAGTYVWSMSASLQTDYVAGYDSFDILLDVPTTFGLVIEPAVPYEVVDPQTIRVPIERLEGAMQLTVIVDFSGLSSGLVDECVVRGDGLYQLDAAIHEPVNWRRCIMEPDAPEDLSFELPADAGMLSASRISEGHKELIDRFSLSLVEDREDLTLAELEIMQELRAKQTLLEGLLPRLQSHKPQPSSTFLQEAEYLLWEVTALESMLDPASRFPTEILPAEIQLEIRSRLADRPLLPALQGIRMILPWENGSYEIGYVTPGPTSEETEIDETIKRVEVSTVRPYSDVLVYTSIPPTLPEDIAIFMIDDGARIPVPILSLGDHDDNGLIERVDWVAESLPVEGLVYEVMFLPAARKWRLDAEQHLSVSFNISRIGDLVIGAGQGRRFGMGDDLDADFSFVGLFCEDMPMPAGIKDGQVISPAFTCPGPARIDFMPRKGYGPMPMLDFSTTLSEISEGILRMPVDAIWADGLFDGITYGRSGDTLVLASEAMSGVYASPVLDVGRIASWTSISLKGMSLDSLITPGLEREIGGDSVGLAVRSCSTSVCDDVLWVPVDGKDDAQLSLSPSRYVQYRLSVEDRPDLPSPEISAVEISYSLPLDATPPVITVFSPANRTGDPDGDLSISFAVADASPIGRCILMVNGEQKASLTDIQNGEVYGLSLEDLPKGRYSWDITCNEATGQGLVGKTGIRTVDVIKAVTFNGSMTNLSTVDVSNITNLTLTKENMTGITFLEPIDLSQGADLDSAVSIEENFVSVDTSAESRLNRSARITFSSLSYAFEPVVLRDGVPCDATECPVEGYSSETGTLVFSVPHFTNYTTAGNAQLMTWDETDNEGGLAVRYPDDQIVFFANYTDTAEGQSINETGTNCSIRFNESGYTPWFNMSFDKGTALYFANHSFPYASNWSFHILCTGAPAGFEDLNITDNTNVTPALPDLYIRNVSFSGYGLARTENVTVFVNVTNNGTDPAHNTTLRLAIELWNGSWVGDENQSIDITYLGDGNDTLLSFQWATKVGTYRFLAIADIAENETEHNETNNELWVNYTTSAWGTLYGYANHSVVLTDDDDAIMVHWPPEPKIGVILYSDIDSDFDPADLIPLNKTGDLSQADAELGMTYYEDSLSELFDPDGDDEPDTLSEFEILGKVIQRVPVINSVASPSFLTGLMWDSGDGGEEYDGTQDIVIITRINESTAGAYGTYDYEVRLPYRLKEHRPGAAAYSESVELI
ncbi:MAG: CARDB domain-containing protein [archaeon]